jgi:hypothetical protein
MDSGGGATRNPYVWVRGAGSPPTYHCIAFYGPLFLIALADVAVICMFDIVPNKASTHLGGPASLAAMRLGVNLVTFWKRQCECS